MRFLKAQTWSYAILLIVLFSIASLAVWATISYLEEHVPLSVYTVFAVLMWTITLGFMLIAGAFGLWAIRFAAESESRRRIGLLVDAMGLRRPRWQGEANCAIEASERMGRTTGIQRMICGRACGGDAIVGSGRPCEFDCRRNRPVWRQPVASGG